MGVPHHLAVVAAEEAVAVVVEGAAVAVAVAEVPVEELPSPRRC